MSEQDGRGGAHKEDGQDGQGVDAKRQRDDRNETLAEQAEEDGAEESRRGPRKPKKRRRQNKANLALTKQRAREQAEAAIKDASERAAKVAEANEKVKRQQAAESAQAESVLKMAERAYGERAGTLSDWLNPKHRHHWKALKDAWAVLSKSKRAALIAKDSERCKLENAPIEHAFESVGDDHCETAPEAYEDVARVLELLARKLGKSKSALRIYDPYYCAGSVVRHLASLGFHSVYNENEDFYKREATPPHDVVVTNPPYSGDHVERLLAFAKENGRPVLLLMPNYVVSKSYFDASAFSFIVPYKRYNYWTPKGLRSKDRAQNHVSTLGVRTSPFLTFWYLAAVDLDKDVLARMYAGKSERCQFVASVADLPETVVP